jgi:succinate dehydrogenase/fumarate reductase flavoprotein subunit
VSHSETVDVIVVGGGGAALAAAAEAARLGRSVVLLERAARFGGTTRLSVGSLMGSCTRMQRQAGIEDSPDQHEIELSEIIARGGFGDNTELRRVLVDHSGATVDFLESIGVDFIGPLQQPPFRISRFYQALPGGHVYVRRLVAHCRRLRVDLRLSAPVETVLKEGDRVTGVVYRDAAERRTVFARCGVVLAAGDMSADADARRALWGAKLDNLEAFNPGASGDGQRLGVAAGGRLVLRRDLEPHATPRFALPTRCPMAQRLPAWRPVTRAMGFALRHLPSRMVRPFILRAAMTALAPEKALYEAGAVLVNRDGERFVEETGPLGNAIAAQEGGTAFVVMDGEIARQFSAWPHFVSTAPGVAYAFVDDYRVARPDIFFEAQTIAGLAARLRCDPDRLAQSVTARNPAAKPPFIAIGPLRSWLLLTPAGLAVSGKLEVLDCEDQPIPGLYAAGGNGQGGLSFTHYYHGHSLGWAFTSGRLAGREVACRAPHE